MDAKVERPRHHTTAMKARLEVLIAHLRADVDKVDGQFKAMFVTSAEAPGKAFSDYVKKNERAWRGSPASGAGAP